MQNQELIQRIALFVEANPWHGGDGKFSSARKLAKSGDGSYSKGDGRPKYQIDRGKKGPKIQRVKDDCGREDRPYDATRCKDQGTPDWARRRYKKSTLKGDKKNRFSDP